MRNTTEKEDSAQGPFTTGNKDGGDLGGEPSKVALDTCRGSWLFQRHPVSICQEKMGALQSCGFWLFSQSYSSQLFTEMKLDATAERFVHKPKDAGTKEGFWGRTRI